MTTHMQLDSYTFDGARLMAVTYQLPTADGGTVSFHRPFVPIGPELAVTPVVAIDGQNLTFRLDKWVPMFHGMDNSVVILPLECPTQDLAAQVCRDLNRDPGTLWSAPEDQLIDWCHRWVARKSAVS
jgi:hypothetical protein